MIIRATHLMMPVNLGYQFEVALKLERIDVDPVVVLQDDPNTHHYVYAGDGNTTQERASYGSRVMAAERATAMGVPCSAEDVEEVPFAE
jgi:hypothetical protein